MDTTDRVAERAAVAAPLRDPAIVVEVQAFCFANARRSRPIAAVADITESVAATTRSRVPDG